MAKTSYDDLFDEHDTLKNVTRLKFRYNVDIINRNRDTEVKTASCGATGCTANHAPSNFAILYLNNTHTIILSN